MNPAPAPVIVVAVVVVVVVVVAVMAWGIPDEGESGAGGGVGEKENEIWSCGRLLALLVGEVAENTPPAGSFAAEETASMGSNRLDTEVGGGGGCGGCLWFPEAEDDPRDEEEVDR